MKYSLLIHHDDIVGTFVQSRIGSRWTPGSGNAIGLVDESGKLVAGVTYTMFNGANIVLDVLGGPPGWCRPEYLYAWLTYPFDQLGCKRVTAQVCSTNIKSQRFVEKLGFKLEAVLEKAFPDGDVLVYRMFKDECRWLVPPKNFPKVIK